MTVEAFRGSQIASVLMVAVVAGCVPALQPILLGGLLAEHRLAAEQVGQAAMVEALGMAVSTTIAGAMLRPERLRLIAVAAALAMIVANGFSMVAGAGGIFAARALNGAASGLLLWILVGLMTRAANPGRLFALYVTAQAIASFLLSALFTGWVVPRFGVGGGYGVLVGLAAALLVPAMLIAPRYGALAMSGEGRRPSVRGLVGLLAVACFMAGIFSFWVYLQPLATSLGHDPATVGRAISIAIGVQVFGGLVAFVLAGRVGGVAATLASAVGGVLLVMLVMLHPATWSFYLATSLFAFFWMFCPPFHLPLLMRFDPSNRAAMFISPAQLAGVASGPMIASLAVGGGGFGGAAAISIASFAACILLVVAGRPPVQKDGRQDVPDAP